MPKIFDFTLLTQNKDGKSTEGKVYNYFWKTFDFRNGRTLQQVQDEHPYAKTPSKCMSKCDPFPPPLTGQKLTHFISIRPILLVIPLGRHLLLFQRAGEDVGDNACRE